jgi:hypothetical protein
MTRGQQELATLERLDQIRTQWHHVNSYYNGIQDTIQAYLGRSQSASYRYSRY